MSRVVRGVATTGGLGLGRAGDQGLNMMPSELMACAEMLRREADMQADIYHRTRAAVLGLDRRLVGRSYDAYLQRFIEQEEIMRNCTDLLREYADLLTTTAEEFGRMDDNAAQSFSKI